MNSATRKRIQQKRALRQMALKQLDMASMLKCITSLRKTLIEANRSAQLTMDDLEDCKYLDASVQSAQDMGTALDDAIDCVREASECVYKAVELTKKAKDCLRGDTAVETDLEQIADKFYRRIRR